MAQNNEHDRDDCRPCGRYEDMPERGVQKGPQGFGPCPETLEEACKHVNEKFREWKRWGSNTNHTLLEFAKILWRLEHAVCCLEGHVIYGHARPRRGLICDEDGEFRDGTLHKLVTAPWPITDPPDEPWD